MRRREQAREPAHCFDSRALCRRRRGARNLRCRLHARSDIGAEAFHVRGGPYAMLLRDFRRL
jgi:hypothetical protein